MLVTAFFFAARVKKEARKKKSNGQLCKKQAKPTAPLNTRNFGKVTCGKR